jgi:hypothetical protein
MLITHSAWSNPNACKFEARNPKFETPIVDTLYPSGYV